MAYFKVDWFYFLIGFIKRPHLIFQMRSFFCNKKCSEGARGSGMMTGGVKYRQTETGDCIYVNYQSVIVSMLPFFATAYDFRAAGAGPVTTLPEVEYTEPCPAPWQLHGKLFDARLKVIAHPW